MAFLEERVSRLSLKTEQALVSQRGDEWRVFQTE